MFERKWPAEPLVPIDAVYLYCRALRWTDALLLLSFVSCVPLQGRRKRDLLHEVLPVIGQNLRFQRLFTEYQDQLELLRSK